MPDILLRASLLACAVAGLSGCVLAPQTIALNDSATVPAATPVVQRDALVRVVDQRELGWDVLGHRGGRAPENSPLLADEAVKDTLTRRMQASLKTLGFGGSSPVEPLRVQLDIETFNYACNEGVIVNECSVNIELGLTVLDGGNRFSKPYKAVETRSLAASPVATYNEKWVNEVLDNLWAHMFSDDELLNTLQVQPL